MEMGYAYKTFSWEKATDEQYEALLKSYDGIEVWAEDNGWDENGEMTFDPIY